MPRYAASRCSHPRTASAREAADRWPPRRPRGNEHIQRKKNTNDADDVAPRRRRAVVHTPGRAIARGDGRSCRARVRAGERPRGRRRRQKTRGTDGRTRRSVTSISISDAYGGRPPIVMRRRRGFPFRSVPFRSVPFPDSFLSRPSLTPIDAAR